MYLKVVAGGIVKLEDAANFRSFKVVVAMPNAGLEEVRRALAHIATLADRNTAWVFESALRQCSEHSRDAGWQDSLTAMIEKARPHGWVDDANQTIKAHVEWQAS
jgi:predicted transcriptional regulator